MEWRSIPAGDELRAGFRAMRGDVRLLAAFYQVPVELVTEWLEFYQMALPGKANLRHAIQAHGGVVSEVAAHFNVSRQTVYNWLDHYKMRELVTAARQSMREVAKDVIYQRLMSEDEGAAFEAARFVMLHLQGDGELLTLSPETLMLLRRLGLDVSDVVAQFEGMVREAHEAAIREDVPAELRSDEDE